jgi:hypothetical protein
MKVDADMIASRIANVNRLLTDSSAARRIEESGEQAALTRRQEAIRLLERAREAAKAGQLPAANDLLDQSTRTMFDAVSLAGSVQDVSEQQKRTFEDLAATIEVLNEAMTRIAKEKGGEKQALATVKEIEAEVAKARNLADRGEMGEARATLDTAYQKAKFAVETLRQGDTVVRTLTFDTKRDEYLYELDRNETHRMLIDVLLAEKREVESINEMVTRFVSRSDELRREAESQADAGKYEAAIESLEKSTKELVRAIRSAGIYIPG